MFMRSINLNPHKDKSKFIKIDLSNMYMLMSGINE